MDEAAGPNGLTRLGQVVDELNPLPQDKSFPIVLGMIARHQKQPGLTIASAWIFGMGATITRRR